MNKEFYVFFTEILDKKKAGEGTTPALVDETYGLYIKKVLDRSYLKFVSCFAVKMHIQPIFFFLIIYLDTCK